MSKTICKRKSTNKKKLLSKKQNGGAAANPSVRNNNSNIQRYIESIKAEILDQNLINIEEKLRVHVPNLLGIPNTHNINKKCFTFEYLVPDKHLDAILSDPYNWYLTTTKQGESLKFESIDSKNIFVPNYIAIVMGMVKDLLLVLCMNRMPGLNAKDIERRPDITNNGTHSANESNYNKISKDLSTKQLTDTLKQNAKTLLQNIEILIKDNIPYVSFTEIVFQYIMFFSMGVLQPDTNKFNTCLYLKQEYDQIVNSPYILLPSFKQIDFYKVIDLCKAPIVNFRLINTRRLTHLSYGYPCTEGFHDILFHAKQTHHNLLSSDNLKELFNNRNITFNKIQHLYHYPMLSEKSNITELNNYQNCCILFILIHEIAQGTLLFPPFYTEPYTIDNLKINLNTFIYLLNFDNTLYESIAYNFDSFKRRGVDSIISNFSTKKTFISSIAHLISQINQLSSP